MKNNGVTPRTGFGWGVVQVQVWLYSLWLRALNMMVAPTCYRRL